MKKCHLHLMLFLLAGLACYGSLTAEPSQTPVLKNEKKVLTRKTTSTSTRPRIPSSYTDYLTYTINGDVITMDIPVEFFPAIMTVTEENTGFSRYSATLFNNEPIELGIEAGEYVLTVTLVDNRVYGGSLEIE